MNGLNGDRLSEEVGQRLPKLIGIDVATVFHNVSLQGLFIESLSGFSIAMGIRWKGIAWACYFDSWWWFQLVVKHRELPHDPGDLHAMDDPPRPCWVLDWRTAFESYQYAFAVDDLECRKIGGAVTEQWQERVPTTGQGNFTANAQWAGRTIGSENFDMQVVRKDLVSMLVSNRDDARFCHSVQIENRTTEI